MSETPVLEGPGWVSHGLLDVRGGLFPLSVESHFISTIGKLLPGATTVTTLARYYSLHAFVSTLVEDRNLDRAAATVLLRRCEIVVGAATVLTGGPERAHAHDAIEPRMSSDGFLDVASLVEAKGGYSDQRDGFVPAYLASEIDLGLLGGSFTVPGERADRDVLTSAFHGLTDLIEKDRIELDELRDASQLSINALATSPDGPWLARLLCGVGVSDLTPNDQVRNDTARLLGRALEMEPASSPLDSFRRFVLYGPALDEDPVAAQIAAAKAWRGCLFRHQAVGAWRALWYWTVEQIGGETDPRELVEVMAEHLPGGTLSAFLGSLPSTQAAGHPAPAEEIVRGAGFNVPTLNLALLALGARRYDELTGHAQSGFADGRPTVLSPVWLRNWLDERREREMGSVAADLVEAMLDRSRRVAFRKMRVNPDGSIWLPTRVHERNGLLYRVGSETSRNVGVRLEQYARLLTAVGVLDRSEDGTTLTSLGSGLLGEQAR